MNIYCGFYWAHALIRRYLTTGRKHALIKKHALNKHVRLLTRLYGIAFISLSTVVPDEINHTNNVSTELVSLDSVDVTWSIPSANNDPIVNYTLMFCALFNGSCGSIRTITLEVGRDSELMELDGNRLRYTFTELSTEKEYEVVVRAANTIGQQTSPAFGNGRRFNSAFPDDGQVVNVANVSSTDTIILTWNLPPLALALQNIDALFNITYFRDGNPSNILSVAVEYNASLPVQGVSVNLMMADSAEHTFQIGALYTNPNLLSSQAILTGVRTLADGTRINKHTQHTECLIPCCYHNTV